jgi:hypothetical protein
MSDLELFDHQENFLLAAPDLAFPQRACLYFKTGAGKSLTAILGLKVLGWGKALVIAPPSTHHQWVTVGQVHDVELEVMSHAKFRMKDTKLSRSVPIIADEFHLFGGQKGQGWKKLDTLARHLQAPLFLLSATPNYNDAERCYCVQHILDPGSCSGGYLQFLYTHCVTEQNPFGMEPRVLGFHKYPSAVEFLAAMPGVFHLPDDLVYSIEEVDYYEDLDPCLENYGYNSRDHKMVGSIIEMRHTMRYQGLVNEHKRIKQGVMATVVEHIQQSNPILIYSNHSSIAEALAYTLDDEGFKYAVVTGDTPKIKKQAIIGEFLRGEHSILIGTATLATGTDGMDRVCDTLLILDDTDDDALRRQLIGRIMPRGDFVSIVDKRVVRMNPI